MRCFFCFDEQNGLIRFRIYVMREKFAKNKNELFFSRVFYFRSDIDTLQFQMTFEIPHIRVRAQYRSSGVLILVKASGAGDYWGEYGIELNC